MGTLLGPAAKLDGPSLELTMLDLEEKHKYLVQGIRGVRQNTPVLFLTGRNEPCPCGKGQKYKRCCMPGAVRRVK